MPRNLNQVTLIGRLGQDPEIRHFQNGGQIAHFNLAVGDDYRNQQGEIVNRTYWFPVKIDGKYAETAGKLLHKGSKIAVTGKLIQESWQDQNGNNRTAIKIHASVFEMLDTKQNQPNQSTQATPSNQQSIDPWEDSDIPF